MSPCTWLLARGLNPRMYICMHIKVKKEVLSGLELARATKVFSIQSEGVVARCLLRYRDIDKVVCKY